MLRPGGIHVLDVFAMSDWNHFIANLTAVLIVLFFCFGFEDFFVDVCALILGAKPEELTWKELQAVRELPEKRIAILVAAWKEDGVLKNMIRGNSASILYRNYSFFLGVYPNDHGTLKEALEIAAEVPNVHVVVNSMEGPTCKGQMLNVLVRGIFEWEVKNKERHDAFMIHDSEDLIHRDEFKIVNRDLDQFDFIQIPVFSLPVSPFAMVAGVYIDEFAESHSKTVIVRNKLQAPIPSAGVGTTVSRKLVLNYMERQSGDLLNMKSLTEDYELGLSTKKVGFASKFSCYFTRDKNGKREYIATREYFPKGFHASVRQKSRWTLGIAFQGTENLGWEGGLTDLYFLMRDRKGPFCNFLVVVAFLVLLYDLILGWSHPALITEVIPGSLMLTLMQINLFFMVNRILQRMWSVYFIYGWRLTLLSPIRWPLANLINFLATYAAIRQFIQSKISGMQPKWVKTDHELPAGFGTQSDSVA